MKVGMIVQARMGSTRLPGKIMKQILGKPILSFVVERLKRVKQASVLHIATTTNPLDGSIVKFCEDHSISYSRGSEDDVLDRFYQAASQLKLDVAVRVNSDCPLIDPALVDHVIGQFLGQKGTLDYASNILKETYPVGMHTEVFTRAALAQAHQQAKEKFEREHVTPFIYRNPQKFKLLSVESSKNLGEHRWVVDTPEDFELAKNILETLYPQQPEFGMKDVLDLLAQHPEWLKINSHIRHKTVYL